MRYPKIFIGIMVGFIIFALITGAPIIGAIIMGLFIYRAVARVKTRYRMNYMIDKNYEAFKKKEREQHQNQDEENDFRI